MDTYSTNLRGTHATAIVLGATYMPNADHNHTILGNETNKKCAKENIKKCIIHKV